MEKLYLNLTEDDDGNFIGEEVAIVEYDVYFLLKNDNVIYIGCSSNVENRIKQHKKIRDFDSYFIYMWFTNKEQALICERMCIKLLSNFSHNPLENKVAADSIFKYRDKIKV